MEIKQSTLDLIKSFEGCRLEAYKDIVGVPTIGCGNTYYEDGSKVKIGDTLTQEGADRLLANTLKIYANAINKLVTSNINQSQFDSLVSFCYNIGIKGFTGSSVLRLVNKNTDDYERISGAFQLWSKAGGKTIQGLLNRRIKEANLFMGKY